MNRFIYQTVTRNQSVQMQSQIQPPMQVQMQTPMQSLMQAPMPQSHQTPVIVYQQAAYPPLSTSPPQPQAQHVVALPWSEPIQQGSAYSASPQVQMQSAFEPQTVYVQVPMSTQAGMNISYVPVREIQSNSSVMSSGVPLHSRSNVSHVNPVGQSFAQLQMPPVSGQQVQHLRQMQACDMQSFTDSQPYASGNVPASNIQSSNVTVQSGLHMLVNASAGLPRSPAPFQNNPFILQGQQTPGQNQQVTQPAPAVQNVPYVGQPANVPPSAPGPQQILATNPQVPYFGQPANVPPSAPGLQQIPAGNQQVPCVGQPANVPPSAPGPHQIPAGNQQVPPFG